MIRRLLVLASTLLLGVSASAQVLTTSQATTLRNDIQSRPALNAALVAGEDQLVADWYNQPAQAGEYTAPLSCWRPNFTLAELNAAIDWAAHAALTQQRQLTYLAMTQTGVIDLTDNQVRAGITTIYGAGSASETNIFTAGARPATRFEALIGGIRGANRRCVFFGQLLTPQTVSTLR